MIRAEAVVTLTLVAPILTRQSTPGAPGVDDAMARREGQPMLPYSLIQGRLREAWEEIGSALDPPVDAPSLAGLLGSASRSVDDEHERKAEAPTNWNPARGQLSFSDFVATTPAGAPSAVPVATRLKRDAERRAAEDGALRHVETPYPPGQKVGFEGRVRWLAPTEKEAEAVLDQITRGLRWVASFGAERTAGFGRLAGVAATLECRPLLDEAVAAATGAERFDLALTFADPLCLAERPEGGNLFESSEMISGSVIKGTLARMLQQLVGLEPGSDLAAQFSKLPKPLQPLARHFSAVRFLFAFPAKPGQAARPWVAPQSLVETRDGKLCDIALCKGDAVLLDGAAPAFAIDWKDSEEPREILGLQGWHAPGRELRVRTAIDRKTRRGADEQLFAYEMLRPEGVEWRGVVDLFAVPENERRDVEAGLRQVLEIGLVGVGKTSAATRTARLESGSPLPGSLDALENDEGKMVWVVTLQSPALLVDPSKLDESSTAEAIGEEYKDAWQELSGKSLTLVRRFTRERLAGGYLGLRFGQSGAYRPFLLTAEGSTFVLAATGKGDPAAWLKGLARDGLGLPTWARDRHGESWQTCPFTRADGFGEVAVNLAVHSSHHPSKKGIKVEVLP